MNALESRPSRLLVFSLRRTNLQRGARWRFSYSDAPRVSHIYLCICSRPHPGPPRWEKDYETIGIRDAKARKESAPLFFAHCTPGGETFFAERVYTHTHMSIRYIKALLFQDIRGTDFFVCLHFLRIQNLDLPSTFVGASRVRVATPFANLISAESPFLAGSGVFVCFLNEI